MDHLLCRLEDATGTPAREVAASNTPHQHLLVSSVHREDAFRVSLACK